jgi:hypothetical protein
MAEAVASSTGVNMIGVVGYLTTKKGFEVLKRNCPPEKP